MKSLAVVIDRELICLTVNCICSTCASVGIRSDHSTEETLSRIIHIIIYIVVTEDNIVIMAVPVRCPQ